MSFSFDFITISSTIIDFIAIIALAYLFVTGIKRTIKAYKETQMITWIRLFLSGAFFFRLVELIFGLLFNRFNLPHSDFIYLEETSLVSVNSIIAGLMILCGAFMFLYIFKLDRIMLVPLTYYSSAIVHYFFTGNSFFHTVFIYVGGSLSLLGLYYASFKVKDNQSLSVAILFTFLFVTAFIEMPSLELVFDGMGVVFSLLLVFDKFKPFKNYDEVEAEK